MWPEISLTSVRISRDSNATFTGAIQIIALDVARDFLSAFSAVILSEWQSVLGGASSSAQGSGVAIRWSSGQWGRGKDGGRSTAIGHEPYS